MTREEAKDYIREWCPYDRQEEIIKALEQEPCDKCVYSTSEGCQYDDITETIPPFDDCISRQAVNILVDELARAISDERCCMPRGRSTGAILKNILDLPPIKSNSEKPNKWIPVNEKLPKPYSYVNCTLRSLIDDRASWVVETFYLPQPKISPYSDWGNIPMLNCGKCEVVAWMYRKIPEPYKAEGSGKE